jgi:hypothetical protein
MCSAHVQWSAPCALANAGIPNAPAGGTIRATEAPSTTEQPRKAAKSARWDGLTFDTEDEIIISSSGSQLYPAEA